MSGRNGEIIYMQNVNRNPEGLVQFKTVEDADEDISFKEKAVYYMKRYHTYVSYIFCVLIIIMIVAVLVKRFGFKDETSPDSPTEDNGELETGFGNRTIPS